MYFGNRTVKTVRFLLLYRGVKCNYLLNIEINNDIIKVINNRGGVFVQIRRWNEKKPNTDLAAELAELCEIHPFLSLMLTARGWDTPEQIFAFLIGVEEEVDPFSYVDMERAVERIQQAIDEKQRVLVYGDYDTDGITATVLLYTYLKQAGVDVLYRIPLREEGYGLHSESIEWAAEQGVQLIVTVDTGVTAVNEIRQRIKAVALRVGISVAQLAGMERFTQGSRIFHQMEKLHLQNQMNIDKFW